jgi:hypothetical protein
MSMRVERLAVEGTINLITTLNVVSITYRSDPSQNNAEIQVSGNVTNSFFFNRTQIKDSTLCISAVLNSIVF